MMDAAMQKQWEEQGAQEMRNKNLQHAQQLEVERIELDRRDRQLTYERENPDIDKEKDITRRQMYVDYMNQINDLEAQLQESQTEKRRLKLQAESHNEQMERMAAQLKEQQEHEEREIERLKQQQQQEREAWELKGQREFMDQNQEQIVAGAKKDAELEHNQQVLKKKSKISQWLRRSRNRRRL